MRQLSDCHLYNQYPKSGHTQLLVYVTMCCITCTYNDKTSGWFTEFHMSYLSVCPVLPSYLTIGWYTLFSQVTIISDWSNVCQPEINPSEKYKA
jgi:hypothetical protein